MLNKTRGIILHQIKYSDSSKIVNVYTEKFGRQDFIISESRNKKSKSKHNVLQALFLVEIDAYVKNSRQLQRIKEIKNIYPFKTIPYNITKSTIVQFIAEILYKSLHHDDINENLFNFLFQSIQLFDEEIQGVANFHLFLLVHLTKFLGFFPNGQYSEESTFFDLLEGRFVMLPPTHNKFINAENCFVFDKILNLSFDKLNQIKISKNIRSQLLDNIIEYYQLHILSFKEIKSLQVFKSVFE
ncbi:MAG: DNA repair protein RecO [Bacteroidetes bacterium]|nr:MAG: DNA repair protein RecO [Bacteroidota bacterium]